MSHKFFGTFLICGALACSFPTTADETDKITEFRQANEHQILDDFRSLLKMPNVAKNTEDMMVNANWITSYIGKRGFNSEIVTAGGAPYIIAEKQVPDAKKTILIYAHFDGQPVEPENWASSPFEPTLRDGTIESGGKTVVWPEKNQKFNPNWRIFARSAGDDKAPIIALMAALDALNAAGIQPSVNIKLILDGEEEAGSPSLERILKENSNKLDADLMLFCDGPMHQSRQRQLVFGVRGAMTVDLTTYGPIRPLHSGHYGNWAPNPTDRLMALLVSMKDESGRIIVPNYHDEVIPVTAAETAAIAALPNIGETLAEELALGAVEGGGKRLEELILEPAIIVKGFQAGGVGEQSRNIIMPSAAASLNLRLVKGQTPEGVRKSLINYFVDNGFHIVNADPTPEILKAHKKVLKVDWRPGAYGAFKSDLNSTESRNLISILNSMDGKQTLLTPTMGGSLPIYLFEQELDMPIILLPIANHDNNQHGRNENLRLQNLWDAIDIYAAVLSDYGKK